MMARSQKETSFCKQNAVTRGRKFQRGIYLTKPFERRGLCSERSEVNAGARQPRATRRLGTALTAAAGLTGKRHTTEPSDARSTQPKARSTAVPTHRPDGAAALPAPLRTHAPLRSRPGRVAGAAQAPRLRDARRHRPRPPTARREPTAPHAALPRGRLRAVLPPLTRTAPRLGLRPPLLPPAAQLGPGKHVLSRELQQRTEEESGALGSHETWNGEGGARRAATPSLGEGRRREAAVAMVSPTRAAWGLPLPRGRAARSSSESRSRPRPQTSSQSRSRSRTRRVCGRTGGASSRTASVRAERRRWRASAARRAEEPLPPPG